jgi:PIN domain nuclease of toxin-antitoxin system
MSHLAGLPSLHRDPFDRLLVTQALQHGLTFATVDPELADYPVPLLPMA